MTTPLDWTDVASIRKNLAAGSIDKAQARMLDAADVGARSAIAQLTDDELVRLAKSSELMGYGLGNTARALAKTDKRFEAALRIYDSLLAVPVEQLGPTAGTNALMWVQNDEHKLGLMPDRARRYLEHFLPYAVENPAIFINAMFVSIELGELDRAVEQLRKAILAGDPAKRWLSHAATRPLHDMPSFKALEELEPEYPPALRWLKTSLCVLRDEVIEQQAQKVDIEWIEGSLAKSPSGYPIPDAAEFRVLGSTGEGGDWAFWRRGKNDDFASQPIVFFGSDGMLSVYADCLQSFLCLFAHSQTAANTELDGFLFADEKPWSPPGKGGARKLKPNKAVLAAFKKAGFDLGGIDASKARAAALSLIPALQNAVGSGKTKK